MAIRIITDSICDVPKKYVERYNIKVIPLTVHFGDESYIDGIDLTLEEFLKKLETADVLPTTSQVPPVEFFEAFKEGTMRGNEVIAILGSSQLSGTYNSAVMAKEQLNDTSVHVIDSKGITLGAGMLVIKAAQLAEEGLSAEAIVENIESSKSRMEHFIILDTLKYLHKGGRLSLSASVLGSILNIKPVLTVKDGKLELFEKSRGIKKAITAILDRIRDNGWSLDGKVIGINHIADLEHMKLLEEEIRAEYKVKEIIYGEVGSVVATHGGPGAVAFYFEN
ncbi:MAG: DegV family protein [Caulobacteraceae bacterium]